MDLEKSRRETLRWRILQTLDVGRPYAVAEDILLATVAGQDLPATPTDVRREIDYLEERNLVKVSGRDSLYWSTELTRVGIDLVEYTVDCEPGIARPRKYW